MSNQPQQHDDHPLSPSIESKLFREGQTGLFDQVDDYFSPSSSSSTKPAAAPSTTASASATTAATSAVPVETPAVLTLDDAPHRLTRARIAQLPVETLVSLVQALSARLDAVQEQARTYESDLNAVEQLVSTDKGISISSGEIERAKVRARTATNTAATANKEWKIALSLHEPAALDLQDLADAISDDNAFSSTDVEPPDTITAPEPAANKAHDKVKQTRARHASLSSRILGSLSLSPPPASTPAASASASTTRSKRSGSILSNNTDTSEPPSKPYSDWMTWRTWGRSSRHPNANAEIPNEDDVQTPVPQEHTLSSRESSIAPSKQSPTTTPSRTSSRERALSNASSAASSLMPTAVTVTRSASPSRKPPSLLQVTSPDIHSLRSPATMSFTSSSTGDVPDDRSAHIAALSSSTSSVSAAATIESVTMTPSTSQGAAIATVVSAGESSAKAILGKALGLGSSTSMSRSSSAAGSSRRLSASTAEPNLTLFPPKLGKYSPFAATAVSMPTTTAEIVQNGSPSIPVTASMTTTAKGSTHEKKSSAASKASKNASLELDSIPSDTAPPTLTSPLASLPPMPDAEGPLVDRYGFVYDLKSSMKLLREARRRRERKKRGEGSNSTVTGDVDDEVQEAAAALLEAPLPSLTSTAEEELEELKLALGISTGDSPSQSRSSIPHSPSLSNVESPVPPRLVRSKSSDSSPLSVGSSTKRLLAQLTDMQEANESVSKERWEDFMQRRQKRIGPSLSATSANGNSDHEWSENLIGIAQLGVDKKGKGDWREFKKLVRSGVPMAYRPKIWAECSGANEAREPGVYQELLDTHRGRTNQCLTQINMDCHRTFPTNVFFAGNGPGVAKLRNVLVAYSWRNPAIGYCQGMNNLTAMLLLIYTNEEDAFWVLVCMIENILPQDYYTSQLLVSQADQRVLAALMQKLYPALYDKMDELGVELPALTFGWFLSLFTDALPIQTLLRVWDLLFVFGTVMLFRIALAVFALHEKELVECDSASTFYSLVKGITAHLYQVEPLLKIACEDLRNAVKEKDVARLREQFVEEMTARTATVTVD